MGDNCTAVVDVTLDRAIRMPIATIYSPYWIQNKTGAKLEYKVQVSGPVSLDKCVAYEQHVNLVLNLPFVSRNDTTLTVGVEGCPSCCTVAALTKRCL